MTDDSKDKLTETSKNVAISRPAFVPVNDRTGTEHITKQDLAIPRLALAQGLTPEVLESKEGFSVGVLFNSATKQVYGKGPLNFVIVRADPPRAIEFYPRETGGGVKDMNVPLDDPRMNYRPDPEHPGQSLKPLATKFYDYLLLMLPLKENPLDNLIALSFKSSGLKMALALNMLIFQRDAPLFAGVYKLTTDIVKSPKGTFAVYQVDNAGWISDEPTYELCKKMYDSLRDREVKIDREHSQTPDPDEFDAERLEREAAVESGAPRM